MHEPALLEDRFKVGFRKTENAASTSSRDRLSDREAALSLLMDGRQASGSSSAVAHRTANAYARAGAPRGSIKVGFRKKANASNATSNDRRANRDAALSLLMDGQ